MKLSTGPAPAVLLASMLCSSAVSAFAPNHQSQRQIAFASASKTALEASRRDHLVSLLGASSLLFPLGALAERPSYLTDPTEEFKANEAKAAAFNKQQRAIKAKFTSIIDRFTTQSKTAEAYIVDLNELTDFVYRNGGLPTGIKKEDLYKVIRTKKAAGLWPTDVEIA
jgi:hypothetical protein